MNPATGSIRIVDPVFEAKKRLRPAVHHDVSEFTSQWVEVQIIGLVFLVLVTQFGPQVPVPARGKSKLGLGGQAVEPGIGRLLAEPGCGAPGVG